MGSCCGHPAVRTAGEGMGKTAKNKKQRCFFADARVQAVGLGLYSDFRAFLVPDAIPLSRPLDPSESRQEGGVIGIFIAIAIDSSNLKIQSWDKEQETF